jgi:hypothetical protein
VVEVREPTAEELAEAAARANTGGCACGAGEKTDEAPTCGSGCNCG